MLNVTVVKDVPDVVLSLVGELDMMTGDILSQAVDSLDQKRIESLTFSLRNLEFIDSTGVGQLLGYYKRFLAKEAPIYIDNDNPDIEEVLELIGVREIIKS